MTAFEDFWDEVLAVWDIGVFGASLGEVMTALTIFLLFLFARRLVYRFVILTLMIFTRRTKTNLDDLILEAIEKPLELAFVVVGLYVAQSIAPVSEDIRYVFDKIDRSLIAFIMFWIFYRVIEPLSHLFDRAAGLFGSARMHETMKKFFVKIIKAIVVCLGGAAVFQEWGFNVAAVLGSLGLVGMAVALGAKDFIANMFAGLTIFMDRMFEKGNWIRTPDVDGIVEDIGFRATKIRRFDKALVTIPNGKLAREALVNFSRMTNRRIYWTIGLEYRTTQEQLRDIIREILGYLKENQDFETDPSRTKTFVFVDSFGASSIDVMLYCFTKTTDWGEWLAAKEKLAYRVKEIVESHGAGFAFPSSSIYVETLPFGKPELFPLGGQQNPQHAGVSPLT